MAIIIKGIQNNNSSPYLINNPIKVEVSSDVNYNWLDIDIYRQPSFVPIYSIKLYPNSQYDITFDLSVIIKSLFKKISTDDNYTSTTSTANNIDRFRITFRPITNQSGPVPTELNVNFIRAGINSLQTNNTHSSSLDIDGYKLFWKDNNFVLPSASYSFNSLNFKVEKTPINENTPGAIQMPIKSCNYTYVKFLNNLGGFSYWLFENTVTTVKSSSFGSSIYYNDVTDYGVEVANDLVLTTKVDKQYLPILKSLVYSPMILIYKGRLVINNFERVVLQNNSITDDPNSNASFVTLKLIKLNNFNPSAIW